MMLHLLRKGFLCKASSICDCNSVLAAVTLLEVVASAGRGLNKAEADVETAADPSGCCGGASKSRGASNLTVPLRAGAADSVFGAWWSGTWAAGPETSSQPPAVGNQVLS